MAAPLVPSAPVGYGNSRRLAGDARDGRLRHLGRNNMERLFEEGTPQEKFECEEIVRQRIPLLPWGLRGGRRFLRSGLGSHCD